MHGMDHVLKTIVRAIVNRLYIGKSWRWSVEGIFPVLYIETRLLQGEDLLLDVQMLNLDISDLFLCEVIDALRGWDITHQDTTANYISKALYILAKYGYQKIIECILTHLCEARIVWIQFLLFKYLPVRRALQLIEAMHAPISEPGSPLYDFRDYRRQPFTRMLDYITSFDACIFKNVPMLRSLCFLRILAATAKRQNNFKSVYSTLMHLMGRKEDEDVEFDFFEECWNVGAEYLNARRVSSLSIFKKSEGRPLSPTSLELYLFYLMACTEEPLTENLTISQSLTRTLIPYLIVFECHWTSFDDTHVELKKVQAYAREPVSAKESNRVKVLDCYGRRMCIRMTLGKSVSWMMEESRRQREKREKQFKRFGYVRRGRGVIEF
jgi:hypothetical protein